jgi:hypothetical protein
MLKVIVAAALVIAFLGPAVAAFAADGEGNGGDHTTYVADDTIQLEPATPGNVAGTDQPNLGPYHEQRLDNMGQ